MMKKLLFLVVLAGCISLFYKEEVVLVSYDDNWNNYDYNFFYLKYDDLNTNNLYEYLSDLKVIEIFPYINPLYPFNYSYKMKGDSLYVGLKNVKREYLNLMDKFNGDKNQYLITGIPIKVVLVYASNIDVYEYLLEHTSVQVSKDFSGDYIGINQL